MENSGTERFIYFLRQHKRTLITAFVVVIVVMLWSRYSILTVTVQGSNNSSGEITYQILRQADKNTITKKTSASSITKLVRKGDYEVTVSQGENHHFMVAKAKGFLRRTKQEATLTPERSRQFVGNNPDACMSYGPTLISYACISATNTIAVHVAATEKQPTYTLKNPHKIKGTVEDIIETRQGTIGLFRHTRDEEIHRHLLYLLDDTYRPIHEQEATNLNKEEFYNLVVYKDGFVAYNQPLTEAHYYESLTTPPKKVTLTSPGENLKPVTASVGHNGKIAVLFSSVQDNAGGRNTKNIKNTFAFTDQNGTVSAELDGKEIGQFTLCETNYLCLLSGGWLEVYELKQDKLAYQFKVSGVHTTYNVAGSTIALRDNDVLRLDTQNRRAVIDYTFGPYKPCGAQPASPTTYLLCVQQENEDSSALLINTDQPDKSSIDKKVAELLRLPEVKDISPYKQFIFVSPEAGRVVLNPQSGYFEYDPAQRRKASEAINQKVEELKIDRSIYKIINTLDY